MVMPNQILDRLSDASRAAVDSFLSQVPEGRYRLFNEICIADDIGASLSEIKDILLAYLDHQGFTPTEIALLGYFAEDIVNQRTDPPAGPRSAQ